ncbi:hypothetical protein B0I35DRAFT_85741 [Stachybotrys elegans]|uniref:Uncharacterized protein n=1 Tax=Stachybotrys elegans TaxID=80388 RepID=A0A8K0SMP4_9HYPO|nr:hypothetical protein B0I35DRAFT_85741 [Stachybotrys elegans]
MTDDNQPSVLWAPESLPQLEDAEFQALIKHESRSPFKPAASQCKSWENAPNPKSPSSFGDRGTTATVNAYGGLVQFGTYTGRGRSGLFTADLPTTAEPYRVLSRTEDLHSHDSNRTCHGLRVSIVDSDYYGNSYTPLYPPRELPQQQFVNYRWPRFEQTVGGVEVTTQWMVHDGLVLQNIRLVNDSDRDVDLQLKIHLADDAMWIRDLEHIDDSYAFNESQGNHRRQLGPHGYGWVLTRKIESPPPRDATEDENRSVRVDGQNDHQNQPYNDNEPCSIAIILSVMEDGQLRRFVEEDMLTLNRTLKADGGEYAPSVATSEKRLEVTVAYNMILLSGKQSHWKDFLISAQAMDIAAILSKEPFNNSLQISTMVETTDQADHVSGGGGDEGASEVSVEDISDTDSLSYQQAQPSGLPENAGESSPHIEFVVRRQLEHILSTCSIPLKPPRMEEDGTFEDYWANDAFDIPVALTCGDLSFHRITASASFFAFYFLVSIAKRLKQSRYVNYDKYTLSLLTRITSVCRGHLAWLKRVEKSKSNFFVGNYWVTGQTINNSERGSSWIVDDHLTNTAFHIIKIDSCTELNAGDEAATTLLDFSDVCISWLRELEKQDRRKCFAWPHACEGDVNIFRLDDHVWIWRALKGISQIPLEPFLEKIKGASLQDTEGDSVQDTEGTSLHKIEEASLQKVEEAKQLMRRFAYRDVQRQVLRRFTTQNDVSGKRMLAVTRSCRETRFLLHARDTVLFYAREWGIFLGDNSADTSSNDLWASTVKAQHYHDENDEVHWDNALRYALAILMGSKGYRINHHQAPSLVRKSIITLLKSSSSNGLFAGQLDKATKEPVLFHKESDRDFHFHATFEIPYLLLACAIDVTKGNNANSAGAKEDMSNRPTILESGRTDTGDSIQFIAAKRQALHAETSNPPMAAAPDLSSPWQMEIVGKTKSGQKSRAFKKLIPFNHLIDSTNIAEIEEEWLYNYPAFFPGGEKRTVEDVHKFISAFVSESASHSHWIDRWLMEYPGTAASLIEAYEEIRVWVCHEVTIYRMDRQLLAKILLEDSGLRLRLLHDFGILLSPRHQAILKTGKFPEAEDVKQPSSTSTSSSPAPPPPPPPPAPPTPPTPSLPFGAIETQLVQTPRSPSSVGEGENYQRPIEYAINDSLRPIFQVLQGPGVMWRLRSVLMSDASALVRAAQNFEEFRVYISRALISVDNLLSRVILKNDELRRAFVDTASNRTTPDHGVIRRAMTSYLGAMLSVSDTHRYLFGTHKSAWIMDIGKKKSVGKRSKDNEDSPYSQYPGIGPYPPMGGDLGSNDMLWTRHLEAPRTVEKAKKRFVWLPQANLDTALICYLGSPEVEHGSMSLFFDRHVNYELYFFDDTTPHMNTWETEVHLSFYQILPRDPAPPTKLITPYEEPLPGHGGGKIAKASVGFRIFGDFFDRYWTCHLIEHTPAVGMASTFALPFDENETKGKAWAQRKVLELVLFERIIVKLVDSTREIYERMKTELGVREGAMSLVDLNSDDYFLSSGHWQQCQQTLQAVEDQLGHVSAVVAKWESREKDRGLEKPRWTRNDERKYRGDIKKRLSSSNSKIRDMQRLHADIRTLKELLTSRQDQIRNDLSLRGAENIRFFTYVTVVFLPLGFASSIFSMSEVPSGSLIGSMAVCATVAFMITVVALINAETLGNASSKISRHIAQFSQLIRGRSWLIQRRRKAKAKAARSEALGDSDTGELRVAHEPQPQNRDTHKTRWHARFWLIYLLVELPAQRVALAYGAMKEHTWTWATCLNIMLALCLLPFCILVWLFRIAVYNATDLTRLLWHDFVSHFQPNQGQGNDPFEGAMELLLMTDNTLRPLKVKLEEKKQNKKKLDEKNPKSDREPEKLEPVVIQEKPEDTV